MCEKIPHKTTFRVKNFTPYSTFGKKDFLNIWDKYSEMSCKLQYFTIWREPWLEEIFCPKTVSTQHRVRPFWGMNKNRTDSLDLLLCYYSFCQGTSLGFWSFFLYEICRTSICSLIIPKWRHFSDITGLFIRYLTADAWVSGPDLAPQKFLLSQQFRHLMRCKKYLEEFFSSCLVSEIQLFVYIFGPKILGQ